MKKKDSDEKLNKVSQSLDMKPREPGQNNLYADDYLSVENNL